MALQCNIDAKGQRIRLIMGLFALACAILITLCWAIPFGGFLPWIIAVALLGTAAFTIFESRAGWCAFRAMGIKTKF
jgi:hypothetical protein